jgi:hypothetical protein
MLLAPAIWNGYPLLQSDTGGYLARWYEGYLVPSRSTVFGLYLHFGEDTFFWINLGIQALATMWILQLTLRVFGMAKPVRLLWMCLALSLGTALPWLSSMLLTDIFAGLSVLSLFILVLRGEKVSGIERAVLFALTAFAAASHSATMAVLLGLCIIGWIARPFLRDRISITGIVQGSLTVVTGAAMLLAANFALSGQLAWTPGGYSIAFARMLQDGIVTQYLHDHCATEHLRLCPYRDHLPETADDFLWSRETVFNRLGRFAGMSEEMGYIATHALADYPLWQAKEALIDASEQMLKVATGENTDHPAMMHTYGVFRRYLRQQLKAVDTARQQTRFIAFGPINLLHVPVALISTALIFAMLISRFFRRLTDDVTLLTATVCLALLGNAFVCGVISGPHDRYGSRLVWTATFTIMIAAVRRFMQDDEATNASLSLGEKIQHA